MNDVGWLQQCTGRHSATDSVQTDAAAILFSVRRVLRQNSDVSVSDDVNAASVFVARATDAIQADVGSITCRCDDQVVGNFGDFSTNGFLFGGRQTADIQGWQHVQTRNTQPPR